MDDADYGLQYSDDSGSEPDVQLENQYYAAKGLKSDGDTTESLKAFLRVLELETEKGDWGFKALKQMVKLTFNTVIQLYNLTIKSILLFSGKLGNDAGILQCKF